MRIIICCLIAFTTRYVCLVAPTISVVFPACHYWDTGHLGAALVLLIPAAAIFYKHWKILCVLKRVPKCGSALSGTKREN